MTWVELNEAEQRLAKFLAKSRHRYCREQGIENKRYGPQDDWQTDLDGVGAEIAFCKLTNSYPDMDYTGFADGDSLLINGMLVDVKSTRYKTGKLMCVRGKQSHPADMYALMIGEFPRYRCAGLATAAKLIDDANLTAFGNGQPTAYALQQGDLDPIDQFGF